MNYSTNSKNTWIRWRQWSYRHTTNNSKRWVDGVVFSWSFLFTRPFLGLVEYISITDFFQKMGIWYFESHFYFNLFRTLVMKSEMKGISWYFTNFQCRISFWCYCHLKHSVDLSPPLSLHPPSYFLIPHLISCLGWRYTDVDGTLSLSRFMQHFFSTFDAYRGNIGVLCAMIFGLLLIRLNFYSVYKVECWGVVDCHKSTFQMGVKRSEVDSRFCFQKLLRRAAHCLGCSGMGREAEQD